MNNIKISNKILVDYDLLFDEDFGLRQVILDEYTNDEHFKIDMLSKLSKNILNGIFINRSNKNPLSIMLKSEYINSKDTLYEEFMNELDYKIINLSPKTDFVMFIKALTLTKEIDITILCKKLLQKQNIKNKLDIPCNIIVCRNNKINIDKYDSIYIKSYDILNLIEFPRGKNIYIANYKFNSLEFILSDSNTNNIDKEMLENIYLLSKTNKLSMIDIYDNTNIIKPIG